MSIAQSFSCALLFENSYDISPKQLKNVIAMSSGNSLFIDASLLCDPISPPERTKLKHVVGNVGKPGIALLVPPIEPNIMTLGIERWHLINFNAWDGQTRDSFTDSSLHIWFTGFTQEVDIGHSGGQDKELYILESVVALHAKAEWIADLDIMKCAESFSLIHRHTQVSPTTWLTLKSGKPQVARSTSSFNCGEEGHRSDYQQQKGPLVAVENWSELLTDTQKNCIFLAKGNWQARLAAMMICVRMKRKVCLLPNDVCWDCVNLFKSHSHDLEDPIVYIH
ncbi:hypothetical protein F5Y08DRAFT_274969 [Xylaria arbuscula]|nr:hypothetical protein F5Y08DRAFT_274969 [Xylaria arbuscula]